MDYLDALEQMDVRSLRAIWMDDELPKSFEQSDVSRTRIREEAALEYWRRVADGREPFVEEELLFAISCWPPGLANGIGELARNDRLPASLCTRIRCALRVVDDPAATWALRQLNAREALRCLSAEGLPYPVRALVLEFVLVKGVAWAVEEVWDSLTSDEQGYIADVIENNDMFTRRQRNRIRRLVDNPTKA